MLDTTLNARVQVFLDKFEAALVAGDLDAAVGMFAPECYWRDLVAFTWNIKTMEGRDQVRDMLSSCLARVKPRNWKIAEGETATEAGGVTESWISFETEVARGYGLIRLQNGLIWTMLTTMVELKGHEEKEAGFTRPLGARHGVNPGPKTWKERPRQGNREARPRRNPTHRSSSAAAKAASRSARGCASKACPPSSSRRTPVPAIPGATATSRSACTTQSGTITPPYVNFPLTQAGVLA